MSIETIVTAVVTILVALIAAIPGILAWRRGIKQDSQDNNEERDNFQFKILEAANQRTLELIAPYQEETKRLRERVVILETERDNLRERVVQLESERKTDKRMIEELVSIQTEQSGKIAALEEVREGAIMLYNQVVELNAVPVYVPYDNGGSQKTKPQRGKKPR